MRRVLIVLVAAALAVALLLSGQSTNAGMFKDVPTDHWTYAAIDELESAGILKGLQPDSPTSPNVMCRYEAGMIVSRTLSAFEDQELRINAKPVHKLLTLALMFEYEAELIDLSKRESADENVDATLEMALWSVRLFEEAYEVLSRWADVPVTDEERSVTRKDGRNIFRDVPCEHWTYKALEELRKYGLIEGYPDGVFRGRNVFSRYEMAMVVARVAGKVSVMQSTGAIDLKTKIFAIWE